MQLVKKIKDNIKNGDKAMKRVFLLLIVFVSIGSYGICQVNDINGWDKAKWGMSKREINALYGITRVSPSSDDTQRISTYYKIGNYNYDVWFNFRQDSLYFVSIMSENIINHKKQPPTQADCKALEDELIKTYGNPHKTFPTNSGLWVAGWGFPSTSISFSAGPGIKARVDFSKKFPQGKPW
jgi:hypothetical protein